MTQNGKQPAESAVHQNVYKIFPNDLNSKHTVFGGLVMGLCDRTALIVAERHSGHSCVTVAVDSLTFPGARALRRDAGGKGLRESGLEKLDGNWCARCGGEQF